MSAESRHLDGLQRWMLGAITDPAGAEPAGLAEIVLPSQRQSAAERLAVYSNAYFARLLQVLRELFPCTRFAVGDELFDRFAVGYLHEHPPHSYTLGRLADRLVDYLEASRPADWGDFVVELARLEQAIDRIFDAPGPEGLQPLVIPAKADSSLKLQFVPGFELQAFRYPVSRYYTDWKAGRQPEWPQPREQFVALFRRDYVVRRYELSPVQHELLSALGRGISLGDAVAPATRTEEVNFDDLEADVRNWFTFWAAERFFATMAGN
jgi:hypothetical protein